MALEQTTLSALLRETSGKGPARRLRATKMIPAVVYGPRAEKPVHVAVDPKALKAVMQTPHKLNTLITLKLDGGVEKLAMLKAYQQDPVSRALLHADFYEVTLDQKVTVPVPVELTGKAEGTVGGGILQQARRVLELTCLPKDIPEKIEVDVTHLKIAQALHVADVKPPPGTTIRYLTNFTVALVAIPEKEEVVVPVAAAAAVPGAVPAEGAAAAAAPAAGAPAKEGEKAPAAAPAKGEKKK